MYFLTLKESKSATCAGGHCTTIQILNVMFGSGYLHTEKKKHNHWDELKNKIIGMNSKTISLA